MSKRVLVCLVGLPASGKSTLCSAVKKQQTVYGIEHICYDKHITTVDHASNPSAWNKARQNLNQKIANMVSTSDENTHKNIVFLLDDNFYYRGMRKEIFHIAQRHSCVFGQIVFRVSKELAISSNKGRENTIVTEETIQKMSSLIEYPSEGWEKHVLHLPELEVFTESTLSARIDKVMRFMDYLCEQAVEKDPAEELQRKDADREKSLNDNVQQLELVLRKIISQKIKDDRKAGSKIPYSVYSEAKSLFLEEVKTEFDQFFHQPFSNESVSLRFSTLFDQALVNHTKLNG